MEKNCHYVLLITWKLRYAEYLHDVDRAVNSKIISVCLLIVLEKNSQRKMNS